jgi:hypothetical protein
MKKSMIKISKNRKLFYIIFCFVLWGCGNNNSFESSATHTIIEQKKANMAKILFENNFYDFGNVTQGEQIGYTFHFKNVGQSVLIINNVDPSCGCTTSSFPKEPIKPGEQGEIAIILDTTTKIGKISNSIVINANTYPAQTVLMISANVVHK